MAAPTRMLAAVAFLGVLLAACGGGTTADPTEPAAGAASAPAPDAGTEAAAVEGERRILIAESGGVSFSRLPAFVTRDRLNAEGWDIDHVAFAGEDLEVEAVSSGQAHLGRLQALDALRIIELGGDIVNLGADRPDEFVAIGRADIEDCSGLAGQRLAIQSEGSTYTTIFDYWLRENCGVEAFERLVISGGENRVIALLNGEIDGTNVQMADFVTLDQQAPGEFQIFANFAQEIEGLVGGMVLANRTWLEENRELATQYMAELFRDLHEANTDPSALREAAEAHMNEADVESFDAVYEVYQEQLGGWPECGLLDEPTVESVIGLFEELGMIDPGLTPEQVVDFAVLEDARAATDTC